MTTESLSFREQRRAIFIAVDIRRSGHDVISGIIKNTSIHGMCVKCENPPNKEERVSIILRGSHLEYSGVVTWTNGKLFGIYVRRRIEIHLLSASGDGWKEIAYSFSDDHVYNRFKVTSDTRRPGFRVR